MSHRFLAMFASLAFWVALAGEVQAIEARQHKGTVMSASAGRLVMKDTAGKEQSFSVEPATRIMVNGKPGKLEDLQETMPIQVSTDEKGKVLAVSTIDMHKRSRLVAVNSP